MSKGSNAGCRLVLSAAPEITSKACCFISTGGRFSSVDSAKCSSSDVLTDASPTFSCWTSLVSSLSSTTASEVAAGSKNNCSDSLTSADFAVLSTEDLLS